LASYQIGIGNAKRDTLIVLHEIHPWKSSQLTFAKAIEGVELQTAIIGPARLPPSAGHLQHLLLYSPAALLSRSGALASPHLLLAPASSAALPRENLPSR